MKISSIITYLESLAPLNLQESYDNCGLQIGDAGKEISSALITLDVTPEVIEEATRLQIPLIIAHHPLIFGKINRITDEDMVQVCIRKAIEYNIAIYALHTNLDNRIDGVNKKIAERLELQKCKILDPIAGNLYKLITYVPVEHTTQVLNTLFDSGAGKIGNYSECSFSSNGIGTFKGNEFSNGYTGKKGERHSAPENRVEVMVPHHIKSKVLQALRECHPYEEVAYELYKLENNNPETGAGLIGELTSPLSSQEFLSWVKEIMQANLIRHTPYNKTIKTVAVCGGAGAFLIKKSIQARADAFITSDIKYHDFFQAKDKILLCDLGHFESEQFTSELIMHKLLEEFPNFATRISQISTNPIHYY